MVVKRLKDIAGGTTNAALINFIAHVLGLHSRETLEHSRRVARYAGAVARACGLPAGEVLNVQHAAFLHDIGKLHVPPDLLDKPDPLEEEEWARLREHSAAGARILLGNDRLAALAPYVLFHHERWDGRGYPHGLSGTDIPLGARIIAVADAFDAMTSPRPYRPVPKRAAKALQEIIAFAGHQFDPLVVKIFRGCYIKGKLPKTC